jgi:hypothetical protein
MALTWTVFRIGLSQFRTGAFPVFAKAPHTSKRIYALVAIFAFGYTKTSTIFVALIYRIKPLSQVNKLVNRIPFLWIAYPASSAKTVFSLDVTMKIKNARFWSESYHIPKRYFIDGIICREQTLAA